MVRHRSKRENTLFILLSALDLGFSPAKGYIYPLTGDAVLFICPRFTISKFAHANSTFSLYKFIIRSQQFMSFIDIVDIRRCDRYRMYKSASSIDTNMAFHAEFPLISILGLVHFRGTLLLSIFGRTGGIDNRRINDRTAVHDVPGRIHDTIDGFEKFLTEMILLQKMAELQKRSSIRYLLLDKIHVHEFAERIAVIACVLSVYIIPYSFRMAVFVAICSCIEYFTSSNSLNAKILFISRFTRSSILICFASFSLPVIS